MDWDIADHNTNTLCTYVGITKAEHQINAMHAIEYSGMRRVSQEQWLRPAGHVFSRGPVQSSSKK